MELIKLKRLSAEVKAGVTKFFRGSTALSNGTVVQRPTLQPSQPKVFFGVFEMSNLGFKSINLTDTGQFDGNPIFTDLTKCCATVTAYRQLSTATNVPIASGVSLTNNTLEVTIVESRTTVALAAGEGLEFSDPADNTAKGRVYIHVHIIGE